MGVEPIFGVIVYPQAFCFLFHTFTLWLAVCAGLHIAAICLFLRRRVYIAACRSQAYTGLIYTPAVLLCKKLYSGETSARTMEKFSHIIAERRPIAFMSGNVVVDALTVLATVIALEHGSVLSVGAGLVTGGVFGSLVYAVALSPRHMSSGHICTRKFVSTHLLTRNGLLIFLSRFDWPVFAVAVVLAGSLIPAAVLGVSTILYALFTYRLTRPSGASSHQYHHVGLKDVALMAVALVGMTLVVYSQDSGWAPSGTVSTLAGIGAACAAALCSAFSAGRFPAGHGIHTDLFPKNRVSHWRDECAGTMLAMGLGSVPTALVMLLIAAVSGNLFGYGALSAVGLGFVIGTVGPTTGVFLGSATNLNTQNLNLNAILYFGPLCSILVLIAAGRSEPVTLWLAVAGGAVIALANLKLAQPKSCHTTDSKSAHPHGVLDSTH